MRYKYGDRVNFLNDIGGGTVSRVDDRGFVYVQTDDGFEIPVQEKELVFAGSFALTDNEEETIVKPPASKKNEVAGNIKVKPVEIPELPKNIIGNAPVQLVLGFIPENPGPVFSNNLACYLINDSPYFVYYLLGKKEGGILQYISSGFIEAETKSYISFFDQTAISKISDIHIQLIFISKGKYSRKEPVDKMVNLNLVNFNKESYYRNNDYFEEKAVLFYVIGKETAGKIDTIVIPDEAKAIKQDADAVVVTKPKKKEPQQDTLEIDLHLDEETLENGKLKPADMLALQMSRFHIAIDEAISNNKRRLVIIHGLGQGILKMQIRKELQEKYPKFIFQDASFKEYGFGATMVHLTFDQKQ